MSWRGVIWTDSGTHGPLGGMKGRRSLGTHTFSKSPEVGQRLEIAGETFEVVSVGPVDCHVRLGRVRGLDPTLFWDS